MASPPMKSISTLIREFSLSFFFFLPDVEFGLRLWDVMAQPLVGSSMINFCLSKIILAHYWQWHYGLSAFFTSLYPHFQAMFKFCTHFQMSSLSIHRNKLSSKLSFPHVTFTEISSSLAFTKVISPSHTSSETPCKDNFLALLFCWISQPIYLHFWAASNILSFNSHFELPGTPPLVLQTFESTRSHFSEPLATVLRQTLTMSVFRYAETQHKILMAAVSLLMAVVSLCLGLYLIAVYIFLLYPVLN